MIKGKGIYAWQLDRCENGDMSKVVEKLKLAGMTHIIPKVADGIYSYAKNEPYLKNLVTHAHKEGIQVIPYQFVYGRYPIYEAESVIEELLKLPYDGLVINAEVAYRDLPDSDKSAKQYCEALRLAFPDITLCLSTFRFPSYHRGFPFNTFLDYCDYNMPQVYWMLANGTVKNQLRQTILEYEALTSIPMIPTGAAFSEHGWTAIPSDQVVFINEVKANGLQGCNWWEYYHTFIRFPELGQAIIDMPFDVGNLDPIEPDPEPPTPEDAMYVIEMLGNLKIRKDPFIADGNETGKFAITGKVYHSAEEKNGWYRIDGGWISGNTEWTRITEIEDIPEDPPDEPLTLEEKVDMLWDAVFGE